MVTPSSSSLELFASRVLGHAREWPERRAIVCDGDALSYSALADRALRAAGRIRAIDHGPGYAGRVGLIASNGLDFVVIVVACQFAGVTVVPLPGMLTPDALARMIDDAGVTLVFHDLDHTEKSHEAVALTSTPAAVTVVALGGPQVSDGRTLLDTWFGTDRLDPAACRVDPLGSSDIIYSSGTTGTPKGIVQSYQARAAACASLAAFGITARSHLLQTVSLYSNFGLGSFYLTLWGGGTFFMMRKFSGAAAVELLAREPIDHAWFAPATLVRTMDAPGFAAAVRDRPCAKLCAGAPLGTGHKERVLAEWPGPFFDLYGQTETGTLTILSARSAPADKLGSVGTLLPTASVRILDDAGAALPPEAEGEIAGHTTTLMTEYHGLGEAAISSWFDESGRRYIRTGDIGKLDADGYLWLCDRKKDMIISGGYNIYPADLERVLQGHPAVLEVAVVGFPSIRWGETPVAFVTRREGPPVEEDELREWVNARVARIQRVAAVRILPALPSGTMGKILKRELRTRHADALGTFP